MSSGLWTAYESAAATSGMLCARGGDPNRWVAEEWVAGGISIDTRTLEAGDIFVALNDIRDGHEFLDDAFRKGASAALVARAPDDVPDGAPLLVVQDTLEGLRDLARAARNRNFGKRIGVTGSVGKTSTKEMLRVAFSQLGSVHAAQRSFNNHWGVPLTLARMPLHADYGIFEIGMNHAGEITPLTKLVAPDIAIITTVAAAHLEFFSSVEEIAEAKAEIFQGVVARGACILPIDNPHFELLRRRAREAGVARILSFGENEKADFRLSSYALSDVGGHLSVTHPDGMLDLRLAAPGKHQAMNALAVLAAVSCLGQSLEKAVSGLAKFSATGGRGAREIIELPGGGAIVLIDESYNANPTSMAAALALLGAIRPAIGGRRLAVLGEMLELGHKSGDFHRALRGDLIAAGVDKIYATGGLMAHLWDDLDEEKKGIFSASASAVAAQLCDDLRDGDVVMVKGSNASKVNEIVAALKAYSAT